MEKIQKYLPLATFILILFIFLKGCGTSTQVKSTEKMCHKMYSFRGLKDEYKDMLLICVCVSEEKIWVIPYNELKINYMTEYEGFIHL